MRVFQDYEGREVILSDADEWHILQAHREIRDLGVGCIEETLANPNIVINRGSALHHHKMFRETPYGDKYIRVVVVIEDGVRKVRTAYIAKRQTKGFVIWRKDR